MMLLNSSTALLEQASADAKDETGQDRRRGMRIREKRPVKVYQPVVGRYFGGQTEDISSSGLRIELPMGMPLRVGGLVTVHVGVTGKGDLLAHRRSMLPARIVWINRLAGKQARLEAGVELLNAVAAQADAA